MQNDHKFKQALRIRNPKNRLKKILDACKNKSKCEGGDEIDIPGQDTEESVGEFYWSCSYKRYGTICPYERSTK